MTTHSKIVGIGGASAMWGDSAIATPQLASVPGLRYLVYDYLAESTMAILARQRAKTPGAGYATDFVAGTMADHLDGIRARGITVLSNAGGLDPAACRDAVLTVATRRGLDLRIAIVTGDDVLGQLDSLRADGIVDDHGQALPAAALSANVYLGARAVARALDRGADMVITGRVVDSAFVVAALVHEFGWRWDDWDRLAQATLAGHLIECGAQGTGGLFTDWDAVPGWDDIGYPVVECAADGTFTITTPAGTGGLVTPATVAEQVVYEIGDPAAYLMPDVSVDLRDVRLVHDGPDRVHVSGARGGPPPSSLKACLTHQDGFRLDTLLAIRGDQAVAKAQRTADALLTRTRRQMATRGFDDYTEVVVERLGAESLYGPHGRVTDSREIVLRIAVAHRERAALEWLRREVTSPGTSMGPGTRGHFGGRADIVPRVRVASCLVPRDAVSVVVTIDDLAESVSEAAVTDAADRPATAAPPAPASAWPDATTPSMPAATKDVAIVTVPLRRLAHARSGDKGDSSNIGVIARTSAIWPWLRSSLTASMVADHVAHLAAGPVERFELPGLQAVNFVVHRALAGGGTASLRSDPLGKSYAQILLDLPVAVPASLVADA